MAPWSVQTKQTRHWSLMRMLYGPFRSPRRAFSRWDGGIRRSESAAAATTRCNLTRARRWMLGGTCRTVCPLKSLRALSSLNRSMDNDSNASRYYRQGCLIRLSVSFLTLPRGSCEVRVVRHNDHDESVRLGAGIAALPVAVAVWPQDVVVGNPCRPGRPMDHRRPECQVQDRKFGHGTKTKDGDRTGMQDEARRVGRLSGDDIRRWWL